jgi:peptidyl-prolyl cis-trans isomerase C
MANPWFMARPECGRGPAAMRLPPLMRFIALGSVLFAGEVLSRGAPLDHVAPVVLSTATQRLLFSEEQERLGRPLSEVETEQVLRQWEDETLLVEDARRLGLATNDPIVRRRMAEKMRYLLEDAAAAEAPSDRALAQHLERYPERFTVPDHVALDQRFFSRELRGAGMDADAQAALRDMSSGRPVAGDPHPLGATLPLQTKRSLARSLGPAFAAHALEAPVGVWSGPIVSPTGLHLLRISVHQGPRTARLDERLPQIEASWRESHRRVALQVQLDALRRRRGLPERRAP